MLSSPRVHQSRISTTMRNEEEVGEDPSGPSVSKFNFALTRIAVAQICQTVGFTSAQDSALKILTDIAGRYLRAIAKSAATVAATLGCRTQSNLFDIIVALEDLGSIHGFKGFSETENVHCVLTSSLLVELQRFLEYADEIPFAKPLPRKMYDHVGMAAKNGGGFSRNHVPRWLPAMPVIGKSEVERKRREKWEEGFECVTDHMMAVIDESELERNRREKREEEGFECAMNYYTRVIGENEREKKGKEKSKEGFGRIIDGGEVKSSRVSRVEEMEARGEAKEKSKRFEMGEKRGKVKIKLTGGNGKELRKGIFGRKRVLCENEECDGDGDKRKAILSFLDQTKMKL